MSNNEDSITHQMRVRALPIAAITAKGLFAGLLLLSISAIAFAQSIGISEFPIPTASSDPNGIVAGPDSALWFTEESGNRIGRITVAGVITQFPLPTANADPYEIAVASDGALWFTAPGAGKIGRI